MLVIDRNPGTIWRSLIRTKISYMYIEFRQTLKIEDILVLDRIPRPVRLRLE